MINSAYKICSRCIMDASDSNISFDSEGVCDYCRNFEMEIKPNWHTDQQGARELEGLAEKIRKNGKGKNFDCIIGLSGGLDSSYAAYIAKERMGLRPLLFHVDAGWNTDQAVGNIEKLVDGLGLDLYTEVINWEEMKDFQLAFFKSGVPHIDIPQDHAFIATLYHFADKYKIKYILNGGNFSTECVQYPMKYYYYGTDMKQINDIRMQFGSDKMETYPFSSILWHKIYLKYLKGVHVVKPLNYMPFYKEEALTLLENEYGWKRYPQKHFESRFTKFFEGYWLPERFGFDPRRVQFSSLILTGQMSREDALEKLKKPAFDPSTINDEFNYIATKLGISSEELRKYFTMPKKYYWDYKNQQNIFRIGAKALHILGVEKVKKRQK